MSTDCVLCGGPCTHDDGEAAVTAEDIQRLEEIGVMVPISAAAWEARRMNEHRRLRERYGYDPVAAILEITRQIADLLQPKES